MWLPVLVSVCVGALALSSGASAGVGLFDLRTDLAPASRNAFGDVHVASRAALARKAPTATLVRCTGGCTYGKGWLAFSRRPALASSDVVSARAYRVRGPVWGVALTLTPRGVTRWTAFSRRAAKAARQQGLPDALVLAVDGSVAAQPLANQIVRMRTTLRIAGLDRLNAVRTANALR
jgi:hypothetical protein